MKHGITVPELVKATKKPNPGSDRFQAERRRVVGPRSARYAMN